MRFSEGTASALRTSALALVVTSMMIVGAACPAAGRDNIANDEAASDEAEAIDIATGDEGAVVAGPSSTPGQLRTDSQDTQGAVSNETIDEALDRYFDYKERIADKTGILIGTEYTMLAQGGGPAVGDDEFAASGRWALFGEWTLVDRSGPMAGELIFRVENRHTLGTPLESSFRGGLAIHPRGQSP